MFRTFCWRAQEKIKDCGTSDDAEGEGSSFEGEENMFRVILALALAVGMSSCSLFQGDEEELEVSGTDTGEVGNNIGNQEGFGQEYGMDNEGGSFDNQIGGENSSVAEENPLLNNEEGLADDAASGANMDGGGDMPAADFSGEGGVVRYTMVETNVYAQPESSSAPVHTLGQGEVLLVTISGEFAQSDFGFIAVSELSAELQSRVFMGNDWQ